MHCDVDNSLFFSHNLAILHENDAALVRIGNRAALAWR